MDELTPEKAAELNELLSKRNKTERDLVRIRELLNEKLGKSTEYLKQQTELLQEIANQTEDRNDQLDAEISKHDTKIQKLRDEIKLSQENGEIDKVAVDRLRHAIKLRDRAIEKQQELNETLDFASRMKLLAGIDKN